MSVVPKVMVLSHLLGAGPEADARRWLSERIVLRLTVSEVRELSGLLSRKDEPEHPGDCGTICGFACQIVPDTSVNWNALVQGAR